MENKYNKNLYVSGSLIQPKNKKGLGSRIHHRFLKIGVEDFEQPKRSVVRQAPDFSKNDFQ